MGILNIVKMAMFSILIYKFSTTPIRSQLTSCGNLLGYCEIYIEFTGIIIPPPPKTRKGRIK
jgi:hypothetical protein